MSEHLVWPVAILIIVLVFKKPLASRLNNLKKANIKGEFEFEPQQSQTPIKLEVASVNIPIPTDTVGMQKEFEELIRRDLVAANIQDQTLKENILISHLAATQLNASYERVNCSIFGSQIDLLRALNSSANSSSSANLKIFYDDACRKYPEFYKNYIFQAYLDYLLRMGLVEQNEAGYKITKFGIGYLVYITGKGLTGFRHY